MPTLRVKDKRKNYIWQARAKRGVTEYHLGYFNTREEALIVEEDFRSLFPPKLIRGRRKLDSNFPLPLQGKPEREHLYRWIKQEEEYVANKFDDQRNGHDKSLRENGIEDFWVRQIVQYLDRAKAFLEGAKQAPEGNGRRYLEMQAQQAITKCMMTAKGLAESSIRVYGNLPAPGVPSGEIKKEW